MELTISRTAALTGKIAAAIRTVFKRARLLGRYRRRAAVVVISEGRPSRCHDERDRKFADSPLEGNGFELVWGFPCQVVFFSLSPVLCSEAEGAVLHPIAYDQVP